MGLSSPQTLPLPLLISLVIRRTSVQASYDSDKRKLFSAASHASIFISSLVISAAIPVGIMLVSDDPVVKENAKEAVNFHFNIWLYGIIAGVLTFVLIGWLFLPIIFLASIIMPILAILHSFKTPDVAYRYPFIFRVF